MLVHPSHFLIKDGPLLRCQCLVHGLANEIQRPPSEQRVVKRVYRQLILKGPIMKETHHGQTKYVEFGRQKGVGHRLQVKMSEMTA